MVRTSLTVALAAIYVQAAALYLAVVAGLWALGVESIYGHPTPFYGLLNDAEGGLLAHGLVLLVLCGGGIALRRALAREVSDRLFVLGLVAFLAAFAAAVAMLRGGVPALADAYSRGAYEYINDIGVTGSIASLFTKWNELTPYLSMHSKVHPPGPVALLWLLSYLVGREPMGLSILTILFASLSAVPCYLWLRELIGRDRARVGALLFVLVPSVVLFTATSADALFMPFTLWTLYFFERALQAPRRAWAWAAAAGSTYFLMTILKFALAVLGVYFAFRALVWMSEDRSRMWRVSLVAALMLVVLLSMHGSLRLATGYDYLENLRIAKAQFDLDQHHLDELTPRLPAWTYRLLWNPMCWFFFAGIPVSVLFIGVLFVPRHDWRVVLVLVGTLLCLNLLYLARGEGERSALYLFPFLCAGAAIMLSRMRERAGGNGPLWVTLFFLPVQCWVTEVVLYTYW